MSDRPAASSGTSWALFDAMADAVSEAVLVVDSAAGIEFCNSQTERLFGYPPGELAGTPLAMLLAPKDRPRQARVFQEFLAADHDSEDHVDVRLLGMTRLAAPISLELRPSSVDGREQALVLVAISDQTELETAERLRELEAIEEARGHRRFERTQLSTALLDRSGRVTAMNEAWRHLDVEDAEETIFWVPVGQSFVDACASSSNPSAASVRGGVLSVLSGERDTFEETRRCHSPTQLRWIRLQAHALDRESGAVMINQLDVTDVQLARARLRVQNVVAKSFNARIPILAACRQLALTLCDELDWDFAGIWTLDAASWTLRCIDTWARPELSLLAFERTSRAAALGPGTGMPGRAWSTAKVQWSVDTDVATGPVHVDGPSATIMPPTALRAGFRTALCFPLKRGDDVLAVVEVLSRIRRPRDRELMDLLEVCGDQLALWELRERAEVCATVAQQEADQARAQLESVLDCTPAFITAIDRNGKIMFVNKTNPPERKATALDTQWRQFVVPESQAQVESALRAVYTSGSATAYEAKFLLPDGKCLWFANYMGPMRHWDAIVGAVLISQDVTASKRSNEELLAAQRLAAVGTLAAGVAHEINTPIQFVNDSVHFLRDATTGIFGLIDKLQSFHRLTSAGAAAPLLQQASSEVSEAEESADLEYMHANVPKAFERCIDGLERVATIVRSTKEFSHPAQKQMMPVDLNRAIMATLTVARNEYKYVADLETELGPLPPVVCHANDINQAVLNNVVNAAHAIAEAPQKSERGLITVKTRCDGKWVVISITDSGGGISEALRQRTLDPFFTTKEVGRGTGQGLSLAWTAVKDKHGGDLTFDTVLGQGTTFYIRLPVSGKPESPESSE